MPSTALREVSLLQMLSESAFIVRSCATPMRPRTRTSRAPFFPHASSSPSGATRRVKSAHIAAARRSRARRNFSQSPRHIRLLKVEHVEEDGKAMLYLVFEYLDQDLKNFMDLTGRGPANPLAKDVVQDFMYQLCLGCAHLHRHGVMHRDLKPQNLLVEKANNIIKVADLGLGRAFSVPVKSYTHEIVTLWYRR